VQNIDDAKFDKVMVVPKILLDLLPAKSLSINDFKNFEPGILKARDNVKISISPEAPNTATTKARLPNPKRCLKAYAELLDAWNDKKAGSIVLDDEPDVRFPLHAIEWWKRLQEFHNLRAEWRNVSGHLQLIKMRGDSPELSSLVETVERLIGRSTWTTPAWKGLGFNKNECPTVSDLCRILGNNCLNDEHIRTALRLAAYRHSGHSIGAALLPSIDYYMEDGGILHPKLVPTDQDRPLLEHSANRFLDPCSAKEIVDYFKAFTEVENVHEAEYPVHLNGSPNAPRSILAYAQWLKSCRHHKLIAVHHVSGNHWVIVIIRGNGDITYADSLPRVNKPAWWTSVERTWKYFLATAGIEYLESNQLEVPLQSDLKSCGIHALNNVADVIRNAAPTPDRSMIAERMTLFAQLCEGVQDLPTVRRSVGQTTLRVNPAKSTDPQQLGEGDSSSLTGEKRKEVPYEPPRADPALEGKAFYDDLLKKGLILRLTPKYFHCGCESKEKSHHRKPDKKGGKTKTYDKSVFTGHVDVNQNKGKCKWYNVCLVMRKHIASSEHEHCL
jgi:hypothetical protein